MVAVEINDFNNDNVLTVDDFRHRADVATANNEFSSLSRKFAEIRDESQN